ncbi:Hypothetical predicted protein [Pelobates cultripes]|uniref:Uncharacterized protein n=1 Tax=Pelobates cultripes TaxID=61616 RepID=A0AAD1VXI5_PELCU|nr:Hypothetical predicted protein [Pelobates cultripes]
MRAGESAAEPQGSKPSGSTAPKMAEAACSLSPGGKKSDIELRLDQTFHAFWARLEARLHPIAPESKPEASPQSPPSKADRKTAHLPQTPIRIGRQNRQEPAMKVVIKGFSEGKKHLKTTPTTPNPETRVCLQVAWLAQAADHQYRTVLCPYKEWVNRDHGSESNL